MSKKWTHPLSPKPNPPKQSVLSNDPVPEAKESSLHLSLPLPSIHPMPSPTAKNFFHLAPPSTPVFLCFISILIIYYIARWNRLIIHVFTDFVFLEDRN